jgi:uncharacterized protein GlcG (DUF336 family)
VTTATESSATYRTLTAAGAQELIDAAVKNSKSDGLAMSIAVHDAGANLIGFLRMDGAGLMTAGVAQDKSYTAASTGMPTGKWFDVIKDDEPLRIGIVHTPRLTVFGGGYPIFVDGALVGAIGLSGGHYSQDMAVAEAALKDCGFGG